MSRENSVNIWICIVNYILSSSLLLLIMIRLLFDFSTAIIRWLLDLLGWWNDLFIMLLLVHHYYCYDMFWWLSFVMILFSLLLWAIIQCSDDLYIFSTWNIFNTVPKNRNSVLIARDPLPFHSSQMEVVNGNTEKFRVARLRVWQIELVQKRSRLTSTTFRC